MTVLWRGEPFSFSHYCPKKSCGLRRIQWKGGKGEFLWQLSVELDLQCIDFAKENLLQGSTTDVKLNPITLGYRSFPRSGWVTCEYWWLICSQVGGSVANGRNFVICSYWPWYIKSQLGDCQYEQDGIFLLPVIKLDCLLKKEKKRFWAARLPLHMEHWSDYRANSVEARFGNREQVTLTAGSKKEADKFKTFGKYCETLLTINWVSTQLHYISIVFLPGDRMELKLTLHL